MLLPIIFALISAVKVPVPHQAVTPPPHHAVATPKPLSILTDSAGHKVGNVTIDMRGISGSVNVVGCETNTLYSVTGGTATSGKPAKIFVCHPSNQQIVIFGK